MKLFGAVAFCAAAFLLPASVDAQTYRDSGGTILPGVTIVDPASPAGGGTGPLGTSSNPIHTTGGGGGGTSAVYPSGGASGSSNGLANTDANAFTTTLSGPSIAAWATPSSCTLPGSFGSYALFQCLLTLSNSATTISAATTATSVTSLGTSLVVKNSAGNLMGFYCSAITGGAAGYCIAYNGSSAPATGALTGANVLDECYFDTTPRGCFVSYTPSAEAYSTGIVILISSATTPFTYTTGTDTGFIKGIAQ